MVSIKFEVLQPSDVDTFSGYLVQVPQVGDIIEHDDRLYAVRRVIYHLVRWCDARPYDTRCLVKQVASVWSEGM